ncbi:MAG: cytochrome c biogenesis protein ResB [Bacteroidetes bacterium]|nr:cytochrome c biogenesis protein ResB [Bacteroidota bacterium]
MKNKMKKILLSRSTGLTLIVFAAMLCLAGVNIPQVSDSSPSFINGWKESHPLLAPVISLLHFDRMFSSEIFVAIVFLLFFVMSFSVWNLFTRTRKKLARQNLKFSEKSFKNYFSFISQDGDPVKNVIDTFAGKGYSLKNLSQGKYLFRKYGFSRWGGFILHLGMLIIIAAALYTFLFEKRGFIQILERDTFFGSSEEFLSTENGVFASPFVPNFNVTLEKLTPDYYPDGNLKFVESSILVSTTADTRIHGSLSINNPYKFGGVNIYQSTSFGYTICLLLNKNGKDIPTYFSLEHPDKLGKPFTAISDFPTTDYVFKMEFRPDINGSSFSLNQPSLHLIVDEKGMIQFDGTMKPGESVRLGDQELTFVDIRHWSGLILTENQSVIFIFLGFGLVILGLISVYIFPMREIYFVVEKNENAIRLSFGGRAVREPRRFEEEFRNYIESIYLKENFTNVKSELVEI